MVGDPSSMSDIFEHPFGKLVSIGKTILQEQFLPEKE